MEHGLARTRTAMLAAVIAVGAAGCDTPDVEEEVLQTPTPAQASPAEPAGEDAEGPVELTETCESPEEGYAVDYPSGWFVNEGDVTDPCTVFDNEPVILEQRTDIPFDRAIHLGTLPGTLQEHTDEPEGIVVEERSETQVAGRDAVLIAGHGAGDALYPQELQVGRYVIQVDDDRVLTASTYGGGDLRYEHKVEVLDAMVETIRLDASS